MKNTDERDNLPNQASEKLVETLQSISCDQNNSEGAYIVKEAPTTKNKPKSFIPWSFCFEIALVIATCTSAGVAVSQWKTMERQSNIMKEQLDVMAAQTSAAFQQVSTAKISIRIADKTLKDSQQSGKEQSERAEKSLNAAIENFRLDQRAWINLKEIAFKSYTTGGKQVFVKAGQPARIKLSYTNTGKTPARILTTKTYLWFVEAGNKPPLLEKAIIATENQPFTLFPNDTYSQADIISEVFSTQQVEILKTGQYVMYIYGMIPYEDVFGQTRWTQFCNYVTPDFSSMAVCSFYNETDKTRKYK